MAFYASMMDSQYTDEEQEFLRDMKVEVYVDFATDSLGELTYQQATRIYKRLPGKLIKWFLTRLDYFDFSHGSLASTKYSTPKSWNSYIHLSILAMQGNWV